MRKASQNNILESKELKKWCQDNKSQLFITLYDLSTKESEKLVSENLLETKEDLFDTIYCAKKELRPEAIQLLGLKKFLMDFSNMKERQPIEVKLWKEYLIYAQMFGIADKVASQFKFLYPEISDLVEFDYDSIMENIQTISIITLGAIVISALANSN